MSPRESFPERKKPPPPPLSKNENKKHKEVDRMGGTCCSCSCRCYCRAHAIPGRRVNKTTKRETIRERDWASTKDGYTGRFQLSNHIRRVEGTKRYRTKLSSFFCVVVSYLLPLAATPGWRITTPTFCRNRWDSPAGNAVPVADPESPKQQIITNCQTDINNLKKK